MMNHNPPQHGDAKQSANKASALIAPDNFPLAYYNMPKAACTTIKNILFRIQHGTWNTDPVGIHRQIRFDDVLLRGQAFSAQRNLKRFDRPYMVFTFVRDPSARAYSAFVEKIWATGPYAFPGIRKLLARSYGLTLPALENGIATPEEVSAGFKQFLRFVADNLAGKTSTPANAHWAVQSKRIHSARPHDTIGFVGRVENFAEDMSYLLHKAGWDDLSITGQRYNEGPRPPFTVHEVMDVDTARLLKQIYRDDYTAFDYRAPGERA